MQEIYRLPTASTRPIPPPDNPDIVDVNGEIGKRKREHPVTTINKKKYSCADVCETVIDCSKNLDSKKIDKEEAFGLYVADVLRSMSDEKSARATVQITNILYNIQFEA